LIDPAHWQGQTRRLEDQLSDTLHERLMQRFIDRRTSALMRGLHLRGEGLMAGVAADGAVSVEGHPVGRLRGVTFEPIRGASALEDKALRAAADKVIAPEVARRLGLLAADDDAAFALQPDGMVLWRGQGAGQLSGGEPFQPRVRLFGGLGPEHARQRAARRLEAFVAAEAGRRLGPLKAMREAIEAGRIKGLARGLAYRLAEAGGLIDRKSVEVEARALSQTERRVLKSLGVRFGAFSLFTPALLTPSARAFASAFAHLSAPDWRPSLERPAALPDPPPPATALAAFGLRAVAGLSVPVEALEALDAALRAAPQEAGGSALSAETIAALGWEMPVAARILRGLDFAPVRKPLPNTPIIWRRRRPRRENAPQARPAATPFAALAALSAQPQSPHQRARRTRRQRRPRLRAAAP
jgi:ATP-dependent RNA helicase SUPV3L1/SUV3